MFQVSNEPGFWDRIAEKYANGPIVDVAGYERTLERVRHYLKPSDAVFEVGCGTGSTAIALAPSASQIMATDISPAMLEIARKRAEDANCTNVTFKTLSVVDAGHAHLDYDVALAFSVLHLVGNLARTLEAMHRLLKPGGLFISKTACMMEMSLMVRLALKPAQMLGKAPYVAFFDAEELEREIESTGFHIIEKDRHASKGKDFRPFIVARKQ